jgi:hypothetical protein
MECYGGMRHFSSIVPSSSRLLTAQVIPPDRINKALFVNRSKQLTAAHCSGHHGPLGYQPFHLCATSSDERRKKKKKKNDRKSEDAAALDREARGRC